MNQPPGLHENDGAEELPDVVMGYVWVASRGASILASPPPDTPEPFQSAESDIREARAAVEGEGLQVIAESRLGLAVAGSPLAFERLTGARMRRYERLMRAEAGRRRWVTHLDLEGRGQPPTFGVGLAASKRIPIEAVILEQPRVALAGAPSPLPPPVARYHLRVPDDVAVRLGATRAHRDGHTGRGVTVAMVDSGHYAHPFFARHGYDVQPVQSVVPGTDPRIDPVGHGTGESANIFALAPDVTLRPYRASDEAGRLIGAVSGFMRAKQERPDIISNSWGGDGPFPPKTTMEPYERAFAAEILDAVHEGIVVVFSAGNGDFSIEPQVPGVLSAGGAFMGAGGTPVASDYASAYASPFYDRNVPDLCGLVGQRPRAQYLMLPVPPGSQIDVEESQARRSDPPDGTAPDDGWALFSGTSAAAPQLAGAAAVMLGAKPDLTPAEIRAAMVEAAVDVRAGSCHPRFNAYARAGADVATGAGLLDVSAALARVRE